MSVNTELLKNRDFRNTLFAIGANQLSDSMSYITTPIIILALTGSPEAASITPVSYTHLDVYKRQFLVLPPN